MTNRIPVAGGKIDPDVILTRVDGALNLTLMSHEKIALFQKVVDAYLNTRANAPDWLFTLSDSLNPEPVPARGRDWK